MRIRILGLLLATALLHGATAHGAEKRILNLNLFTQSDLRAFAMGNAFGAVARGEGALYYNPAGLAQYDFDFKAEYDVGLEGEKGKFAQDTYALSNSGSGLSAPSLVSYLQKYEGTTQRYNAQIGDSAVANLGAFNFGVGAGTLDSYRYALAFADPNATPGNVFDDSLTASEDRLRQSTMAVAFKFGKGKLLLGLAAKSFRYSERSATISWDPISIAQGNLNFNFAGPNYSTGTTYDVGLIDRLEFWPSLKPQMSLTAFNVGGTTVKGTTAAGVSETLQIPASYNLGFAFGPDTGVLHWLITMEAEDLTDALKVPVFDPVTGLYAGVNQPRSLTQRLHLGAELGLWRTPTGNNILSVRVGNNRGYTTYGYELNIWILRILYARGADNVGYKNNIDKFDFVGYQVAVGFSW